MRLAWVLSLIVVLLGTVSPRAETRVALVIGNSAYQHTSPLPNPKNDASAMTAKLRRLGFDVVDGVDLPRTQFERKVVEFARKLRQADVGLFFYAGHGLQVSGQNYLVPIDAALQDEADLQFSMVRLTDILAQMERSTKTSLIFIDACRDNPLARSLARAMGRTRSASVGRGLAPVKSGIGTMITFATEPGNVALDGEGDNSPFTAALLKHLETPNQDIAPLLRNVRRDVIAATRGRQVPWNHSSLTDDFFFRPGKRPVAMVAAITPGQARVFKPRQFDGRIGKIQIANPSLYPLNVTLWHPDTASKFKTWTIKGQSKQYLKLNGKVFSIGNDWGVQLGNSPVKSISHSAKWQNNEWSVSSQSFFE